MKCSATNKVKTCSHAPLGLSPSKSSLRGLKTGRKEHRFLSQISFHGEYTTSSCKEAPASIQKGVTPHRHISPSLHYIFHTSTFLNLASVLEFKHTLIQKFIQRNQCYLEARKYDNNLMSFSSSFSILALFSLPSLFLPLNASITY